MGEWIREGRGKPVQGCSGSQPLSWWPAAPSCMTIQEVIWNEPWDCLLEERERKPIVALVSCPLLRQAQLHAQAAQAGHPKTTEKFGLKGRCTGWGLVVVPFICATLKLVCPDAEQVTEAVAETRENQEWYLKGAWYKSTPPAPCVASDFFPKTSQPQLLEGANLE